MKRYPAHLCAWRTQVTAAIAVPLIAGCNGPPSQRPGISVARESFGVMIAEMKGPSLEAAEFASVVGGVILNNGNLVIADGVAQTLSTFSGEGDFVRQTGGEGDGPGEHRGLFNLHRYRGDSIMAFDRRLGRITILDSAGVVRRTESVSAREGLQIESVAPFGNQGRFVTVSYDLDSREIGPRHDSASYRLTSPNVQVQEPLVLAPGRDIVAQGRRTRGDGSSREIYSVPVFARWLTFGAGPRGLVVPSGMGFEVLVVRPDGQRRAVTWVGERDLLVTTTDEEEYLRGLLGQVPAILHESTVREFRQLNKPESIPPLSRLVLDGEERIWVGSYAPYWTHPRTWTELNMEGEILGRYALKRPTDILDMRDSWLLAVEVDSLGIELVRLWHRPESERAGG